MAARKEVECEQDFSPASLGIGVLASTLRAEESPFVGLVSVSVVVGDVSSDEERASVKFESYHLSFCPF